MMPRHELIRRLREFQNEMRRHNYAQRGNAELSFRGQMLLQKAFGDNGRYLQSFQQLLTPKGWVGLDGSPAHKDDWEARRSKLVALLQVAIEDLEIQENSAALPHPLATVNTKRVFLVHGHDNGLREAVARFIMQLDLEPIILAEQPSQGRTIIEKIENHADVAFAIVLLSPDDYSGQDATGKRARQNVIFELGYFIGRLGRNRVVALLREHSGFEMPSDFAGVVFVPFDGHGAWKLSLARELKAAGFHFSQDKLLL